METTVLIWIVIIGVTVALLAWFGPRPSQWRSHEHLDVDEDENGDVDEHDDDR